MKTYHPFRKIFGVLVLGILLIAGCGGGGGGGGSSSGGGGGDGTSAGTLDSSFGNSGLVVNAGEFAGSGFAMGTSITTDVMGRILVAGASYDGSYTSDMTVWRYDTDGQPDTSFGNYGIVVNDGAAGGYDDDAGLSITTDFLGRILVAGRSSNGSDDDMVIWRYDANGALDTSFGSSGVVVSDGAAGGSNSNDAAHSITTDNDGKILVTGSGLNGSNNSDMVIWRYESSGQLDTTFGGSGIVVHDSAAGGNGTDVGESITINSKGRILVTGYSSNGSDNDMVIWEYNSDGTLNSSFGTGGIVVSDNAAGGGGNDIGKSITTDSQRRILVTGLSSNGSDNDMVLWRYNPDGTPDTTFGNNGVVVVNDAAGGNGDDFGGSVTIDSQGRILVAGSSFNGSDYDMVIWRFNPDGTPDSSFGDNGVVIEDGATGANSQDWGYSITTDSQGRILVAGFSSNGTDMDMVIWRYMP